MHGIRQCDHIKSVGQSNHLDLKRNSWQDHAVLVAIMVRRTSFDSHKGTSCGSYKWSVGPFVASIKGPG